MRYLGFFCDTLGIRAKRRIIAFMYHALIVGACLTGIYAGMAVSSPWMAKTSAVILALDILTFRIIPVTGRIEEKLIPEARCFGCGAAIHLTGIYKCGCGFVSHKEKHVFSPCRMCGKTFSWITCPECETSIPI